MAPSRFTKLRRKNASPSHFTVLDIGTEVVKALIIKREDDRGVVVGVGKVQQSLADMQAGAVADISAVLENCDRALTEAEDMCEVIPTQAVIGIAGEQIQGFTSTITVPRKQPQTGITASEVAGALQTLQARALREAVRKMAHTLGVSDVDIKLVNSSIASIAIDGYPVTTPFDFQGRQLTLTVFNTFAPLTHIAALETIARELDLELISTVAEPYALAKGCASDDVVEMGGIFIDVGGGTTDVALVRGGGLAATRMFALGGRAFTKRLASDLEMELGEAERFKIAYSEGRLATHQRALAHRALAPSADVLVQGVALILEEIAGDDPLPRTIYLAGGGGSLPEIGEGLRSSEWHASLPFDGTPSVRLLSPADVPGVFDATGVLRGTQDITPMGLAWHIVRPEGEDSGELGGVMKRVMKAMKV